MCPLWQMNDKDLIFICNHQKILVNNDDSLSFQQKLSKLTLEVNFDDQPLLEDLLDHNIF